MGRVTKRKRGCEVDGRADGMRRCRWKKLCPATAGGGAARRCGGGRLTPNSLPCDNRKKSLDGCVFYTWDLFPRNKKSLVVLEWKK
jgi:hypothetical protein